MIAPNPSRPVRGRPWNRIRVRVLTRDRHRCYWCGRPATEADHLIERDRGGSDDLANLVASCRSCNARRGGAYRVGKARRVALGASRDWSTSSSSGSARVFGGQGVR